jgi:hypothetical protein
MIIDMGGSDVTGYNALDVAERPAVYAGRENRAARRATA